METIEENNEITNLIKLTNKTFTLVKDNKTYSLHFSQKNKALEFQFKKQLSPVTYEGIFTMDDFLKIDKIFYFYDDLKDVYQVILAKILDKNFNFVEDDNFLNFILKFEVDNKKKNVYLKFPKNPDFDVNKHVEELSNTVLQLMQRVKKLEDRKGEFYKKSTILKENEFDLIKEWIGGKFELNLLYKSSIHGDLAADFHAKCDNRGPTISFIKNGLGRRFGGYTTLNWDSTGTLKANNYSNVSFPYKVNNYNNSNVYDPYKGKDPSAFIFSLDNKRKFKITDQNKVIYCAADYNVTFGGGHDIHISNNFTTGSYSKFPTSYGSDEKFESYLTGNYYFSVKEVEVYSVKAKSSRQTSILLNRI